MKTISSVSNDFPAHISSKLSSLLERSHTEIFFVRPRRSKLGDFRGICGRKPNYISINNNLNADTFLMVLLHEVAHAFVFNEWGNRIKPHGRAWKATYSKLLEDFIRFEAFSKEAIPLIQQYASSPRASLGADVKLMKALLNNKSGPYSFIEDLPEGRHFATIDGRRFVKLARIRKNYKCQCLSSKKLYAFPPLVRIIPVKD